MAADLIDVWDIDTFDRDLIAQLHANAALMCSYMSTDREILLERIASEPRAAYRSNPHAESYLSFVEDLGRHMEARTIRAWHYTRLTDSEVETLLTVGIRPSTLETTRQRLDAQIAAGQISGEVGKALFEASPLHDPQQVEPRSNKFWLISHPMKVEDDRVTLLLNNWGGEVVYFWLEASHLQQIVGRIGRARVLEVGVPLDATRHVYSASKAVAATFARRLGCVSDFEAFDLCAIRPLGPEAVLTIHTEGETAFDQIGKRYPIDFHP